MEQRTQMGRFGIVLICAMLSAQLGWAQEEEEKEKKLGWAEEAELALVVTAGNAATSTFGFRNVLAHTWDNALLMTEVKGIRTETTNTIQTPVGSSAEDFVLEEDSFSQLTAESYLARAKYDRNVTKTVFLYGSGGWDRNPFAGIQNRVFAAGGVGNIWYDDDITRWRTDYGFSVTHQEPSVGASDTFGGLRLSTDFMHKLSASTTLTNLTIANENLDDTSDFRLDSVTGLAVGIASHLALKVSVQFLFDNQPSFVELPLEFPKGVLTGAMVPVQARELDTYFNVSLVINF